MEIAVGAVLGGLRNLAERAQVKVKISSQISQMSQLPPAPRTTLEQIEQQPWNQRTERPGHAPVQAVARFELLPVLAPCARVGPLGCLVASRAANVGVDTPCEWRGVEDARLAVGRPKVARNPRKALELGPVEELHSACAECGPEAGRRGRRLVKRASPASARQLRSAQPSSWRACFSFPKTALRNTRYATGAGLARNYLSCRLLAGEFT